MVRTLLALACAVALSACAPKPVMQGPALWRLADADSEIWLMGTVHVLPKGLRWKSPAIEAAFARADTIWFETPTDDVAGARIDAIVARDGVNPAGVTLSSQLDPDTLERLARVAASLGVPLAALEPTRPWLAALQLSLAQLAKEGHAAEYGVENILEAEANAAGKQRAYLETVEAQMAIFPGLSRDAELLFLRTTLRQIEEDDGASAELNRLWASGDAEGFARLTQKLIDEAGPETAEALIYARNARWAEQIDALMDGEGRAFVAVGAAHMVGEKGLPALLRAKGFVVEGP